MNERPGDWIFFLLCILYIWWKLGLMFMPLLGFFIVGFLINFLYRSVVNNRMAKQFISQADQINAQLDKLLATVQEKTKNGM